jgi:hypothetical protein
VRCIEGHTILKCGPGEVEIEKERTQSKTWRGSHVTSCPTLRDSEVTKDHVARNGTETEKLKKPYFEFLLESGMKQSKKFLHVNELNQVIV